jgi:hypothetical protein
LEDKIKRTLVKTTIHYHPDKKILAKDIFTERDYYLRDEIIKIINYMTGNLKMAREEETDSD